MASAGRRAWSRAAESPAPCRTSRSCWPECRQRAESISGMMRCGAARCGEDYASQSRIADRSGAMPVTHLVEARGALQARQTDGLQQVQRAEGVHLRGVPAAAAAAGEADGCSSGEPFSSINASSRLERSAGQPVGRASPPRRAVRTQVRCGARRAARPAARVSDAAPRRTRTRTLAS